MNGLIVEYFTRADVDAIMEYSEQTDFRLLRVEELDLSVCAPQGSEKIDKIAQRFSGYYKRLKRVSFRKLVDKFVYRLKPYPDDVRQNVLTSLDFGQFQKLMEHHDIKFIVLPYEFPWMDPLIRYTKKLGIKLILLLKEVMVPPGLGLIHASIPFRSDVICVGGDIQFSNLAHAGVQTDKLKIIGSPKFDYYRQPERWPSKKVFCEAMGIDGQKKTIFFPSFHHLWNVIFYDFPPEARRDPEKIAPPPWTEKVVAAYDLTEVKERILKALCGYAIDHGDHVQVLVKQHPFQRRGTLLTRTEKLIADKAVANVKFLDRAVEQRDIIIHSDLIVGRVGTMLMEGLINRKPTVFIDWEETPEEYKIAYKSMKTMPVASSEEELEGLMVDLLQNGYPFDEYQTGRDKIIYQYCYFQDGQACKRFFEVLERTMN